MMCLPFGWVFHRTFGLTTGKGADFRALSRHYARTDTTMSLLWFDSEDMPEVEVNRFIRIKDDGGLPELTGELPWPGRRRRR